MDAQPIAYNEHHAEAIEKQVKRSMTKRLMYVAELVRLYKYYGTVSMAFRYTRQWEHDYVLKQRDAEVEWRAKLRAASEVDRRTMAATKPLFYTSKLIFKQASAGVSLKMVGLTHKKNTGKVYWFNDDAWAVVHWAKSKSEDLRMNPITIGHHHRDGRAYRVMTTKWDAIKRETLRLDPRTLACPQCGEKMPDEVRFHFNMLRITENIV